MSVDKHMTTETPDTCIYNLRHDPVVAIRNNLLCANCEAVVRARFGGKVDGISDDDLIVDVLERFPCLGYKPIDHERCYLTTIGVTAEQASTILAFIRDQGSVTLDLTDDGRYFLRQADELPPREE